MTDRLVCRRDSCRLCNGRDLELVLELTPTPIADAYVPIKRLNEPQESFPLELCLCRACGHLQLRHVVDPAVLYGEYIYEISSSPGLAEHYRQYADEEVGRLGLPAGKLVVDFGSNDGTLLRFFKDRSLRVLGIDPTDSIARKATEAGIETWAGYLTPKVARAIKTEYGPASLITSSHLFANIDDLGALCEAIKTLLEPHGVFVFETIYAPDLIENLIFDFVYHEHLSYCSVGPLDAFFRRQGLELIDLKHVPVKGGSMRYTVQLAGGPRSAAPSVSQVIAREVRSGFSSVETFTRFSHRIVDAGHRLADLITALDAPGTSIAGYGASATTTTLVYHFGLGNILKFLVDDNISKQGLYSPGYHIPVKAPATLCGEDRPDHVVVLAWRYYDSIIKANQGYADAGGRFIIPLPKLLCI